MKHKGSIIIDKPRTEVVTYFADPAYLGEYQEGFVKKVLVEGEEGQVGAVSKMYYKSGKREMELTETITANNLPDLFEASYHHKQMDNTMKCTFIALNEHRTKYEYEFEYTRLNWVLPRLIALLYPALYRKPMEKWMSNFKEFIEKQ